MWTRGARTLLIVIDHHPAGALTGAVGQEHGDEYVDHEDGVDDPVESKVDGPGEELRLEEGHFEWRHEGGLCR